MKTKPSCIEQEPLIKLDEQGSASILNYNLPQATSYEVVSFIRLDIEESLFKQKETQEPNNHYWSQAQAEKQAGQFDVPTIKKIITGQMHSTIRDLQNLSLNLNATTEKTKSGLVLKSANIPLGTTSFDFSIDHIANKINDGYRPILYKRLSGQQGLKFVKKPNEPMPSVFMVMHMRMASYLGDYGAGQTLSTFSLLPGEKTTIAIRNYQHNEKTRSSSESVLDSYSESAADDLQTTIESSTEQTESASESDTDTMAAELSAEGGVNLGIVKLGGSASGSASSVNTTTEAISSQVNTLNSAVNHHVQTSDTLRQIDINTETTSTSIEEVEQTTSRTLENINKSRVLNFVFRQLLQEYFTITYLDDVSFVYVNGYPKRKKTATLSSFRNLLKEVLVNKTAVDEAAFQIHEQLCNIPDYEGNIVPFIEKVEGQLRNCIFPSRSPKEYTYIRKKQDLIQIYNGKSVKGIILDVTHRIIRTPSVIVDSLLGQGEALDCYNQELQEATYTSAHLANQKTQQAMAIVDSISDPIEKAKMYNNVFGDCCICGENTKEETGSTKDTE